jgi:hypothetical protein
MLVFSDSLISQQKGEYGVDTCSALQLRDICRHLAIKLHSQNVGGRELSPLFDDHFMFP